jgi:predicted GNAT family acetyltransferase
MISPVNFALTRDAEDFAAHAEPLLSGRIECNVMATVLINVRRGIHAPDVALFAYAMDDAGAPRGAAMRVAPWPLLTSPLDRRDAAELTRLWLPEDPELPGVVGVPRSARSVAEAWAAATGGVTSVAMRQAMHQLRTVTGPSRPARGELRGATEGDRNSLIEWMSAFAEEAGVPGSDDAERMVDGRLRHGGLFLWDDGGPVSMIGVQPQVAGVVRIGPVYTPPERRRHGYAGAAVAEASRRALEGGADSCMLFTDLANPTSNKIYSEVGYRRSGDWEEHRFERLDSRLVA